jgi:hypothetical protein
MCSVRIGLMMDEAAVGHVSLRVFFATVRHRPNEASCVRQAPPAGKLPRRCSHSNPALDWSQSKEIQ